MNLSFSFKSAKYFAEKTKTKQNKKKKVQKNPHIFGAKISSDLEYYMFENVMSH